MSSENFTMNLNGIPLTLLYTAGPWEECLLLHGVPYHHLFTILPWAHEGSARHQAERIHSLYKTSLRCLNFWCLQRRRGIFRVVNHIIQLQAAAVECSRRPRVPRAFQILLSISTHSYVVRVSGTAALCLNSLGCNLWRKLVFQILHVNQLRSGKMWNIHYQRHGYLFSRHTKRCGRPSFLTRNFLKEADSHNPSLIVFNVLIFPMAVSISSKELFSNHRRAF